MPDLDVATASAGAIAASIAGGSARARDVIEAVLTRIEAVNPRYNCFTTVTAARARRDADAIDAMRGRGAALPPLAGVPFAVKNLFDIEGVTTLAGARIEADKAPALHDATLVARLRDAGAVLVGALNMDEYAYGFTTVNAHYGATLNPHAPERVAGGSSGGSAAAVAAGLVPLTLGSDTNGSIRVPASLCGIFGLKPTYGRLSRAGAFLFVASLDHLGPFARSAADLAAAFDAMNGPDAADADCTRRPPIPVAATLPRLAEGLRIGILDGYFERYASDDARDAVARAAAALGTTRHVTMHRADIARAAAFVITACEGANLHLARLRQRADDFDPATRDRLLAGAMMPAAWYIDAQRFRRVFAQSVAALFDRFDVLLAAATPIVAPRIDSTHFELAGETLATRPALGLLTQPISFIGLPVVCAPVARPDALPLGVQVVAPPWREDIALRVAAALEAAGVVRAAVAEGALQ